MNATPWIVYIIQTASGTLYTGITKDLARRFSEHASHKKGAHFFHLSQPESVRFMEIHPNRSEATKREIEIKKMSRSGKLALIAQKAPSKAPERTTVPESPRKPKRLKP